MKIKYPSQPGLIYQTHDLGYENKVTLLKGKCKKIKKLNPQQDQYIKDEIEEREKSIVKKYLKKI